MALNNFKLKSSSNKAPVSKKTNSNSGMGTLMALMAAQSKGQAGMQQLGGADNLTAVGFKDPSTGITYKTNESRKFTADAQNQLTRIKQLRSTFDDLEKQANSLPSGLVQGGMAAVKGKLLRGGGGTDAIYTYDQMRPSLAVSVYRAITGDTRLSDADAASRALPMLWHPSEAPEVRKRKFDYLRNALNQAELNVSPGDAQESGMAQQPQQDQNDDPLGLFK